MQIWQICLYFIADSDFLRLYLFTMISILCSSCSDMWGSEIRSGGQATALGPEVPTTGMSVLQQQFILAEAIETWITELASLIEICSISPNTVIPLPFSLWPDIKIQPLRVQIFCNIYLFHLHYILKYNR